MQKLMTLIAFGLRKGSDIELVVIKIEKNLLMKFLMTF